MTRVRVPRLVSLPGETRERMGAARAGPASPQLAIFENGGEPGGREQRARSERGERRRAGSSCIKF